MQPDERSGGSVPRRCAGQVYELDDGGTALYDRAGRQLIVLNDTGAAVWYLIDASRSTADIVGFVQNTLAVDGERARRDVEAFLETLERLGLVTFSEPAAGSDPACPGR